MDKTTYFSSAQPALPLRKFAAYVLDFLVAIIVMLGIFGVEEWISNSTPGVKEIQSQINLLYDDMKEISLSSKLAQKDENNALRGQDDIVTRYLYGSTYQSLIRNGDESLSLSIYEKYEKIDATNDSNYYYYVTFKVEHIDEFNAQVKDKAGLDYYRSTLTNLASKEYFVSVDESQYPYLTYDTAKALNEYFINSSYQKGYTIYQVLKSSYLEMLKAGIKEIQMFYAPLVDLQNQMTDKSNSIYSIKTIELIIAYLLALAIVFVLLPILLKDGRTISFKIMTMGVVNNHNEALSWYNYLIKFVMNSIEFLPMIAITALVFFGASAIDLVGRNLIGDISFLTIALITSLISLVDFLLSFVMRETKQTITEFFAMEIVKDGKVFTTIKEKVLK